MTFLYKISSPVGENMSDFHSSAPGTSQSVTYTRHLSRRGKKNNMKIAITQNVLLKKKRE